MELGKQLIFVVLLAAICALLPVAESRSVGLKRHKIKKRSLYEETCPPPYVIEITEKCKDSCLDDDYCIGNQMCCFDGCSYVCMDPVPSEAVVDWIDDKEGSTGELNKNAEIEIVTPVIEELGCFYHGMMLNDGERLPLGCKICSCFNGNLMCDVANCNKEYQARLALELSGSGSGDDEDGDDKETKGEGSGNDKLYPIIEGLKHKEDFVTFEEFNKNKNEGVEMKEEFIIFPKDHNAKEQSGHEEGSGAKTSGDFVPFDEDRNNENSGDGVAFFARRRL